MSAVETSCFEADIWRQIGVFQAPRLTLAHQLIGVAAVLGGLFALLHPVTVLVTLLADGSGWGATAWSMDITGYLAGVGFALLCRDASSQTSQEHEKNTFWILIWSSITFFVRVLDILMLSGLVAIASIYHTPTGPTLYANIVTEIMIAFPYSAFALIGSVMLRYFPEEDELCTPLGEEGGQEGLGSDK